MVQVLFIPRVIVMMMMILSNWVGRIGTQGNPFLWKNDHCQGRYCELGCSAFLFAPIAIFCVFCNSRSEEIHWGVAAPLLIRFPYVAKLCDVSANLQHLLWNHTDCNCIWFPLWVFSEPLVLLCNYTDHDYTWFSVGSLRTSMSCFVITIAIMLFRDVLIQCALWEYFCCLLRKT